MRHAAFLLAPTSTASAGTRHKAHALALLAVSGFLLAGCQTDGPSSNPLSELAAYNGKKDDTAKTAAKPAEPPMTRSRAAMECWMKTEKGSASANLDKRADIVNKCIDDTLKTGEAPKT
jgi:hypothetical protein